MIFQTRPKLIQVYINSCSTNGNPLWTWNVFQSFSVPENKSFFCSPIVSLWSGTHKKIMKKSNFISFFYRPSMYNYEHIKLQLIWEMNKQTNEKKEREYHLQHVKYSEMWSILFYKECVTIGPIGFFATRIIRIVNWNVRA